MGRALQSLRDGFLAWGRVVVAVQAWILLSLVYILILPWFILFVKAKRGQKNPSGWSAWLLPADTLADAQRQY